MTHFQRLAIDCAKATLAACEVSDSDEFGMGLPTPPEWYDAHDKARALLDEAVRSGACSVAEAGA